MAGEVMLSDRATFIGIDPTAGERPFVYAALDANLRLLAVGQGSIDDVLAFAAGQRLALAAVCAPRQLNHGLMARDDVRQGLNPQPHPGRWTNLRLADYLLRQRNISIPHTPASEADCQNWMRMGFVLHRRLHGMGYQFYPQPEAERQVLEVYPFASYAALLGVLPFPKHSLEGRLQRQLVLYERKVPVPDPMRVFEEITSHRLLKGILPLDELYSPGELDALVAAYTACLVATHPEQVTVLGDIDEGQIVLPSVELKNRY